YAPHVLMMSIVPHTPPGSVGIPWYVYQVDQFVEAVYTTSFVEHPDRKRQSSQTTKILPSPEISADGSGPLRMLPGSLNAVMFVITNAVPKLTPPFVETERPSCVSSALSSGTTTFPFGSVTGCPPMTPRFGVVESVQVRPPLREYAIRKRLPWPKSSHCV